MNNEQLYGTDEWLIEVTSCWHHIPLDEKCEKCGREGA